MTTLTNFTKTVQNWVKNNPFLVGCVTVSTILVYSILNLALVTTFVLCDAPKNWSISFQDPATPLMDGIIALHSDLWTIMLFIAVFVLYMLYQALRRFEEAKDHYAHKLHHNNTLEIVWTMIPAILLCFIAVPSFTLLYSIDEIVDPAVTVKAVGKQWYWQYELGDYGPKSFEDNLVFESYLLQDDSLEEGQLRLLEVDNRLVLPVSCHIRLLTSAADVIHSFAVPSLGIKLDAIPGRLNQTTFFIQREGVFYGQCSELCGAAHGFMPICIEAVSPENFLNWINTKLEDL